MIELSKLFNIGKVVEQLEQVHIHTKADLLEEGSLEGAIQGIPKKELSVQDKAYLKQFYNEHKRRG